MRDAFRLIQAKIGDTQEMPSQVFRIQSIRIENMKLPSTLARAGLHQAIGKR